MGFKSINLQNGPLSEAHPDFERLAAERDRLSAQRAQRKPLSEAEARKEMDNLAGKEEVKAKYKIEITYLESRKLNGPSVCSMTVWESGKRFHGGGDQSMFWCINANNVEEGCGGLIPDNHVNKGMALCPHCKKMVNQALLPVERVGVFSPKNLAKEITKVFRHLGSNADIYLKFHIEDATAIHRVRNEGGEYKKAAIYSLSKIMQDTLGGADITGRFEAFLTA